MSYLQTLYSAESQTPAMDIEELQNYNLEAAQGDVDRAFGLISALESNYNYFVGNGSALSVESLNAYSVATASLLNAAGLSIPVELIAPSFEADDVTAAAKEATEKKDNVLKRAAKALWAMLVRFKDWIKSFFTKKDEQVAVEEKKVEVLRLELKKTVDNAASTDNLKAAKYFVDIPKTWADRYKNDIPALLQSMQTQASTLDTLLGKTAYTEQDVAGLLAIQKDITDSLAPSTEFVTVPLNYDQAKQLADRNIDTTVVKVGSATKRLSAMISATTAKLNASLDDLDADQLAQARLANECAKAAKSILSSMYITIVKVLRLQETAMNDMMDQAKKAA